MLIDETEILNASENEAAFEKDGKRIANFVSESCKPSSKQISIVVDTISNIFFSGKYEQRFFALKLLNLCIINGDKNFLLYVCDNLLLNLYEIASKGSIAMQLEIKAFEDRKFLMPIYTHLLQYLQEWSKLHTYINGTESGFQMVYLKLQAERVFFPEKVVEVGNKQPRKESVKKEEKKHFGLEAKTKLITKAGEMFKIFSEIPPETWRDACTQMMKENEAILSELSVALNMALQQPGEDVSSLIELSSKASEIKHLLPMAGKGDKKAQEQLKILCGKKPEMKPASVINKRENLPKNSEIEELKQEIEKLNKKERILQNELQILKLKQENLRMMNTVVVAVADCTILPKYKPLLPASSIKQAEKSALSRDHALLIENTRPTLFNGHGVLLENKIISIVASRKLDFDSKRSIFILFIENILNEALTLTSISPHSYDKESFTIKFNFSAPITLGPRGRTNLEIESIMKRHSPEDTIFQICYSSASYPNQIANFVLPLTVLSFCFPLSYTESEFFTELSRPHGQCTKVTFLCDPIRCCPSKQLEKIKQCDQLRLYKEAEFSLTGILYLGTFFEHKGVKAVALASAQILEKNHCTLSVYGEKHRYIEAVAKEIQNILISQQIIRCFTYSFLFDTDNKSPIEFRTDCNVKKL